MDQMIAVRSWYRKIARKHITHKPQSGKLSTFPKLQASPGMMTSPARFDTNASEEYSHLSRGAYNRPMCVFAMKVMGFSLTFNRASIWPFKNAESSDIACSFLSTCILFVHHVMCHSAGADCGIPYNKDLNSTARTGDATFAVTGRMFLLFQGAAATHWTLRQGCNLKVLQQQELSTRSRHCCRARPMPDATFI